MRHPRICVCVLMNHPYPQNLPLLREIYKGRFTQVLFLIPLQRMPDEDVITVYRGSYNHSGYLVEAAERVRQADCDYVLVTHDDVLINPKLCEANFHSTFPLEQDEGFIPLTDFNKDEYGAWCWYYATVPKLLYPMSFVFGTGIEAATLQRFLPNPDDLRRKFEASGVAYADSVELVPRDLHDHVPGLPSHLAIMGRSNVANPETLDHLSLELKASLFALIAEADRRTRNEDHDASTTVDLPVPISFSKAYTDFYVVPRSALNDFIHYVGVAAAANLFVETLTPVALFAACRRVRTARDFNLDFQFYGFTGRSLREMVSPKLVAVHPIKLSAFQTPQQRAALLADLEALRTGTLAVAPTASVGRQDLGDSLTTGFLSEGWHPLEPWGRWSCQESSKIEFLFEAASKITGLRIELQARLHPRMPFYRGLLTVNDTAWQHTLSMDSSSDITVVIPTEFFREGAVNTVEITSERMWRPAELDPGSLDGRSLGIGITGLEFTS